MRTVEAIYEALRAACEERCGCVIGDSCDMAVRLYAAAAQIQALEVQAEWVSRQSFPQTAEGEMLDRHAETRGITRLAADESLRARVLGSFRRLPNGANAAFYETGALSHSGVAAAAAVGRARGTGTVNVYLTAPAGAPSQALLAEVEADLAARREIAVDVKVLAPTTAAVNVAAAVKPEAERSFAEVKAAVEEALRRHFTGTLLGKGVLLAELGSLIYQVEGVANCRLTAPTADLAAAATALPVLGTVTITEMED